MYWRFRHLQERGQEVPVKIIMIYAHSEGVGIGDGAAYLYGVTTLLGAELELPELLEPVTTALLLLN